MPLLAPLFLLGLAAVVVPLVVHLVQKEKREPTAFPSLMFLQATPAPFTARRHLRDPLLLLLRLLAIAALVLAFARPVLGPRPRLGGSDPRRREIVLLLDRSFSMRISSRWPRARAAADSVIRTLASGDRMTLVPFDRRAQAVTDATGDRTTLAAALDTIGLTDESTRLAPAITVAQQRFATSDAPRKTLVVISDFQRSGWDLADDMRLTAGAEVVTVDVAGGGTVVDRSVRSVDVREDRRSGKPGVILSARIANVGPAARAIPVRLDIGGRTVDTKTIDLPADGGAAVTFAAFPLQPAPVAARVVLPPDAVPGDDAYHVVLQPAPTLRTVLVESPPSPFLRNALAIGDAPHFDVATRTAASVRATDLAGASLLVLADGTLPTGLGAARLIEFVRNGGGLVVALGAQANPRAWQGDAGVLVPGAVQPVRDADAATGAVLGSLDSRHPALAVLTGERSGDLGSARFLRYRAIDTTGGVLARFDDGSAAITEHAVGRGRVITIGSSLDGAWNDLPRQPAFLPLVQQLAQYAAKWRTPTYALEIGASVRPSDVAGTHAERWVTTAPSGARTAVGGTDAPTVLELREAGVHELRPGGQPGAQPVLLVANIASAELDFTAFDVARLTSQLVAPGAAATPSVGRLEETLADREARQSTWWYLLAAAILLLAAEMVLARRAGVTHAAAEGM